MGDFTPHHIQFVATILESLDRTQWPEKIDMTTGELRFRWDGDDVLAVMGEMSDDDAGVCPVCECTYKDARRLDSCVSLAVEGISRVCVDTHTGVAAPMSYYHTAGKIS